MERFAKDFAALKGETIKQGHADYCGTHGHATHTADGVVQPQCPRCGDVTATENKNLRRQESGRASAAISAALADAIETGSKLSGGVVARYGSHEIAATRAAEIAPYVEAVNICPNPSWITFTR